MTPEEFKRWRRKQGLKQADAARAFAVSKRTVQRWEAGETRVPKMADRMAALLEKQKP